MALSMVDLESKRFKTVKRGYDPEEVESFLRLVAIDVNGDLVEAETIRHAAAKQLAEFEAKLAGARAETDAARATTERVLQALRIAETARDAEVARAERIEQERAAVEAALLGANKLCPQCEQSGHDVATMMQRASETAEATVEHAQSEAADIRRQAEEYASVVRAEVDAYANVTRMDADDYAAKIRTTAHYEGQANLAEIEGQAKLIIDQAHEEAKAIREEAERYAAIMIADLDELQRQTENEARSLVERAKLDVGCVDLTDHDDAPEQPAESAVESAGDGFMADSV